jgi:hypothetical protein
VFSRWHSCWRCAFSQVRRSFRPTLAERALELAAAVRAYNALNNLEHQVGSDEIDAVATAVHLKEDVTFPLLQLVKAVEGAQLREPCEATNAIRHVVDQIQKMRQ